MQRRRTGRKYDFYGGSCNKNKFYKQEIAYKCQILFKAVTLNRNCQIAIVPSPQVFKPKKFIVLNFCKIGILDVAQKQHLMKQLYYINYQTVYHSRLNMSDIDQSQGYTPEIEQTEHEGEDNQVYKRRVEKFSQNSIEGKWNEDENLKYILYMDYHSKIFVSKQKRKSERIFKSLSEFLNTRTPRQCRSHFQKIMNKFKKLRKVKLFYQEELGLAKYQQQYDILSDELKGHNIKIEETESSKSVNRVNQQTQTEPYHIRLSDLSNIELVKLMNLFQEYQQIQMPLMMMDSNLNMGITLPNSRTS